MNKYLLPGAALIGLVSANARGATCTTISPGGTPCTFSETASTANPAPAGSTGLGPLGPVGGIGGPFTFTATVAGTLQMTVQPSVGKFAGDVYQAFVDGISLGFTPEVPLFGPNLSIGTFTTPISAGVNNFDVNDQLLSYAGHTPPFGSDVSSVTSVPFSFSGGGLLVALDELPPAVPEPGSLALLGSWLLGLGILGRYRKRRWHSS
ncbi:MAG TPA: hypothetical protein VGM07_12370 [Stellaceae bacterium]|jgi:hypothetical protein